MAREFYWTGEWLYCQENRQMIGQLNFGWVGKIELYVKRLTKMFRWLLIYHANLAIPNVILFFKLDKGPYLRILILTVLHWHKICDNQGYSWTFTCPGELHFGPSSSSGLQGCKVVGLDSDKSTELYISRLPFHPKVGKSRNCVSCACKVGNPVGILLVFLYT